MNFRDTYPDLIPIEEHIRRAKLERSVFMAYLITNAIDRMSNGVKRIAASLARPRAEPALTMPRQALHR